ncbi:MAG: hypothetical protein CVT92_14790 [Bacteroidetes bacterium HGW-Bacteroidetes-1]|jgi:hypothetical protein|nr:MAG: hypothetical protein CVT92_14790 [Bacteroidetes bacterium HGW-Bacteroidetes-1]
MNVAWNIINIGIAGYALYQFANNNQALLMDSERWSEHLRIKNLYLINAGLDVLYVVAGSFLWARSVKSEKNRDRLKGFGQAIVLQGGFLLIFDLVMYGLQSNSERILLMLPDF